MNHTFKTSLRRPMALMALAALISLAAQPAQAQFGAFRNAAVGGVKIDTDGVLSNPEVGELKELQAAWQKGLEKVPADLEKFTELRFVSLRQLESEVAKARDAQKPIPDSVRYLAGLQRVRYMLVYPEKNDIVIAGPAEGWRIDTLGCVVGKTTSRPVLTLDDLMVAMRVADSANRSGISCSIDPTPEGLQRMQQISGQLSVQRQGVENVGRQLAEAVGPQTVTVTGIPATSHFARVIVAADFRMKRLAMDFEPAPIDGMPSFLTMAKTRRGGMQNSIPRWWLAPRYEPLRRDQDGLAWELRGPGVQCETEQEFLNDVGQKQRAGKTDPTAQKWAATFTDKFEELAREDSSFGQLRNVMDLAVVGALVAKEGLVQKSGFQAPNLMNEQPLDEYPAPKMVPSQASFVRAGRSWMISVSGGVQIFPWQVADRTEVSTELASTRKAQTGSSQAWYWQP